MSWMVIGWSAALALLAATNLLLWLRAARRFTVIAPALSPEERRTRRLHVWLSAVYVLGCAYRSIIPVYDVPRVAMVDSFAASVLVGRSIATLAELCFVAQWALTLRAASRATGSLFGRISSRIVLPLIFVAELCSWYSVISTSNLGHVFEESLWALCAMLMVASLLAAWPRWQPAHRPAVVALSAIGLAYVAYMLLLDVPLYAARWLADEAAGRAYLGFAAGLRDIAAPHLVTYEPQVWQHEFTWMGLYFSFGVWTSIALIHAPLPKGASILATSAKQRDWGNRPWTSRT